MVVHVLSVPTRQMLRRSMSPGGFNDLFSPAKALPHDILYISVSMLRDDRREFQRLKLSKPILAQIVTGPDTANALILDIGVSGAFLEHYGTAAAGDQFPLTFRWQGSDVTFRCEVVRSTVVRLPGGDGKSTTSHTGVRFIEAVGDARARLQDLITTFVGRILDAQRANAAGENTESAGATIRMRWRPDSSASSYVRQSCSSSSWSSKSPTVKPFGGWIAEVPGTRHQALSSK